MRSQWTDHPFEKQQERAAVDIENATSMHVDRHLPPNDLTTAGLEYLGEALGQNTIGNARWPSSHAPFSFKGPARRLRQVTRRRPTRRGLETNAPSAKDILQMRAARLAAPTIIGHNRPMDFGRQLS